MELTVQNASQVVEHFAAHVVGLPSNDLFRCEPDVVKLRPKEVGTLRMQISVPERGGMIAGPYILGLVVKSPYSQEVSRCEELPLDVRPAPALTMNVQPEVANGGKIGNYVINLANEGNMPMAVTLSGTDPENRVGFKFAPRELRLEPGMVAGSQVTVNSDQPLTGSEKHRSATLRAHAGETVVEKPVSFVQRPKIRGGWMKFGALAAGLAVCWVVRPSVARFCCVTSKPTTPRQRRHRSSRRRSNKSRNLRSSRTHRHRLSRPRRRTRAQPLPSRHHLSLPPRLRLSQVRHRPCP
ncbi:COG1470 family protein [Kibdelosporangium aridum]|uniref:COG1470 family protein n=1 Tax=Kibdelosporangium aridum TaxID=2030 RepID=UPI0035EBC1C1